MWRGNTRNSEMDERIKDKLSLLPSQPGVYIMRNEAGEVIYVGKAVNLRNRVRSYFQPRAQHSEKTLHLVADVADVEWIVTRSELEALVLENTLIKRYKPRYNVRLKDDKQYPYIKIHWQEPFPRVTMTRKVLKDGAKYYGPFTSAWAVREALEALRKVFPYVTCNVEREKKKGRACLYYHIGLCAGPCVGAISQEEYREMLKGLEKFLEGDTEEVMEDLRKRMLKAADNLQFEIAARYRDQIRAAEQIVERQRVVSTVDVDEDVIAIANDRNGACVQVFVIRRGKLIGRETFFLEKGNDPDTEEILSSFLKQFYDAATYIPSRVLLPRDLDERRIIQEWLRQKRGEVVQLRLPSGTEDQELLQMALDNAREALRVMLAQWKSDKSRQAEAVSALQEALGLQRPPVRIEGYDISTLQGTNTVGSMVVFVQGTPSKSEYRRFKIRQTGRVGEPNDYAAMREMLRRRFRRAMEQTRVAPGDREFEKWRVMPDLLVVDGGRGQLNVALEVLDEFGLRSDIPAIGLAKREEEIILPDKPDPIKLPPTSPALRLVVHIRDEAHRFAVSYHRKLRGKSSVASVLDSIPGIGPRRRRALLRRFGSLEGIRRASVDELAAVPGMNRKVAETLKEML